MMKPLTFLLVCSLLSMSVGTAVAAQGDSPRRTIAFVVGIERYDDPELNKLQYASNDARAIFEQLRVLSNIDKDASMLLLADDDEARNVDAAEFRLSLQTFARRIKDHDDVIIYLGGHGAIAGRGSLRYLPSNYSPGNRVNHVTFSSIVDEVAQAVNSGLRNVTVTILVNMCNAGNAADGAKMDDPYEIIERARSFWREGQFGLNHLAIIPATQRNRDTSEDPKFGRSIFAQHLLNGLSGFASADGVVTTQSLIQYLEKNLGEGSLPRNADFAGDIVLGQTRQWEGEAEYAVGTALIAAGQALYSSAMERQVSRQRSALLDLAAFHFNRVGARAPDLKSSAMLRTAQIDLLKGRVPSVTQENLGSGLDATPRNAEATEALKRLLEDSKATGPSTPKALHDMLQTGAPHYSLIIQHSRAPATRDRFKTWQDMFEQFSGNQGTKAFPLNAPPASDTSEGLFAMVPQATQLLTEWASKQPPGTDPAAWPRLIVVYIGGSSRTKDDLKPFGAAEINQIAAQWPGPITVFHLAAFGGVLAQHSMRENISLLLASRQPNGVLMSDASGQIASAFATGVENVEQYGSASESVRQRLLGTSPDLVIGTPVWLPTGKRPTDIVRDALAQLSRFALQVASGCALESESVCEAKSLEQFGFVSPNDPAAKPEDPFTLLGKAAERDLAHDLEAANGIYATLAERLNAGVARARAQQNSSASTTANDLLSAIARRALERKEANSLGGNRRLVLIPVGIADYESPQAYDLPKTVNSDLLQYGASIEKALEGRATVEQLKLLTPRTADEFRNQLKEQAQSLAADDLVVLIYSGRGAQISGRRYLAMAGAEPCPSNDSFEEVPPACKQRPWTELVDLWEVAEAFKDKWLFAIYDTQFFDLDSEDESPRSLYEKGLPPANEEGAGMLASTEQSGDIRLRSRNLPVLQVQAQGRLPERQLHLWIEGQLIQHGKAATCRDDEGVLAASSLASSLLTTLSSHTTADYRHWLTAAAQRDCMDGADLKLSAQGELRLPVFSSSKGAELVSLARQDQIRQLINLYVADTFIAEYAKRFEPHRYDLARGAVLGAISLLQDADAQIIEPMKPLGEVRDAALKISRFAEVKSEDLEEEAELNAMRLELVTRVRMLKEGPSSALSELRNNSNSAWLRRRELPLMLVELTEETSRRGPFEQVQQTIATLEDLERDGPEANGKSSASLVSARTQARAMLNSEIARRATAYSIQPPEIEKQEESPAGM
jgi:Caspase domain